MQRWYALETSRGDPYPLYAASNLGSFAGLISYPLIVEPLMALQQQSLAVDRHLRPARRPGRRPARCTVPAQAVEGAARGDGAAADGAPDPATGSCSPPCPRG